MLCKKINALLANVIILILFCCFLTKHSNPGFILFYQEVII
jgi:hypothetical protein